MTSVEAFSLALSIIFAVVFGCLIGAAAVFIRWVPYGG